MGIMIKIIKEKNKIIIKGHALYDDYGKDIVCASVSSVCICTVNGILSIDETAIDVNMEQNKLTIIINSLDSVTTKLIDNMLNCFEELEKQYPNNIKIID